LEIVSWSSWEELQSTHTAYSGHSQLIDGDEWEQSQLTHPIRSEQLSLAGRDGGGDNLNQLTLLIQKTDN
jgi:hypothetical protein